MNTAEAISMGIANRGRPERVFDWNKAARLIREREPETACAVLLEDWTDTVCIIYRGGKPVKSRNGYLASAWATPQIDLDGVSLDCWLWEHETRWNAGTRWPKSALDILRGDT